MRWVSETAKTSLTDRLSSNFPACCIRHWADATIKSANKPFVRVQGDTKELGFAGWIGVFRERPWQVKGKN